jgi:hypothetical protein
MALLFASPKREPSACFDDSRVDKVVKSSQVLFLVILTLELLSLLPAFVSTDDLQRWCAAILACITARGRVWACADNHTLSLVIFTPVMWLFASFGWPPGTPHTCVVCGGWEGCLKMLFCSTTLLCVPSLTLLSAPSPFSLVLRSIPAFQPSQTVAVTITVVVRSARQPARLPSPWLPFKSLPACAMPSSLVDVE